MGALSDQQQTAATANTVDPTVAADPRVGGGPATTQGGVNAARQAADATPSGSAGDEEATPEEQQEYERAMSAVQTTLYENDETADSIERMLQPEQKVDSTVQAALITLSEVDKQLNLDEGVIAQVAMDITDMIIDLGQEGKGIQYSDQEAQAVWGAVWEGVMEMYGVDEEEFESFTKDMSDEEVSGYDQQYKQFLGE